MEARQERQPSEHQGRLDTCFLCRGIWNHPVLKSYHKLLFLRMADLRIGDTLPAIVDKSTVEIAAAIGENERTVQRWIEGLVETGLVRRRQKPTNGVTVFELADPEDLGRQCVIRPEDEDRPLFNKYRDEEAGPPQLGLVGGDEEEASNFVQKMTPGPGQGEPASDLVQNSAQKMTPAPSSETTRPPTTQGEASDFVQKSAHDLTSAPETGELSLVERLRRATRRLGSGPPGIPTNPNTKEPKSLLPSSQSNPNQACATKDAPSAQGPAPIGSAVSAAVEALLVEHADPSRMYRTLRARILAECRELDAPGQWAADTVAYLAVFGNPEPIPIDEVDEDLRQLGIMRDCGKLEDAARLLCSRFKRTLERHGYEWCPNGRRQQRE
jgi:hypothetical protein